MRTTTLKTLAFCTVFGAVGLATSTAFAQGQPAPAPWGLPPMPWLNPQLLAPQPPPPPPPPPPVQQEDSGRGLEWLWGNVEAGASYQNLASLSPNTTLGLDKWSGAGGVFGVAAGARVLFFTGGLRVRYHALSNFGLWNFLGDLGVHIPYGRFDPYASLHFGYAKVVGLSEQTLLEPQRPSIGDVSIGGFMSGLSGGGHYYFSNTFSLGADLTLDFLFLGRSKVTPPASLSTADQNATLYTKDSKSVGFGASGALVFGVHF